MRNRPISIAWELNGTGTAQHPGDIQQSDRTAGAASPTGWSDHLAIKAKTREL
jgi:hypothetical protein